MAPFTNTTRSASHLASPRSHDSPLYSGSSPAPSSTIRLGTQDRDNLSRSQHGNGRATSKSSFLTSWARTITPSISPTISTIFPTASSSESSSVALSSISPSISISTSGSPSQFRRSHHSIPRTASDSRYQSSPSQLLSGKLSTPVAAALNRQQDHPSGSASAGRNYTRSSSSTAFSSSSRLSQRRTSQRSLASPLHTSSRRAPTASSSVGYSRPRLDHSALEYLNHGRSGRDEHVDREDIDADDRDVFSEVIMAIDMGEGGRVGCSYFSAADGTLHIEEEWAMGGTEAVETLLLRVRPTTVLVPNRSSIALIELLERDAQGLYDENIHHRAGSHILRHLVSAEFNYETAKDALACLNIVREGRNSLEVLPTDDHATGYIGSSRHADLTRLSRTIDLDNYISVGCAGAVLGDIERRRAAENVPGENDDAPAFVVRSLIMETPENTMIVSADALISLQILHSELHPNPQANHSNISEAKAKESLSVYGLLQMFARTGPGKAKLRQMLFRPSTDPELIEERQRAIATFLRPQNQETVRAIRKLMGKIKNGKILLRHVRLGVDRIRGQLSLRTKEWKTLLHHAMVAIQIRDSVISLSGYENAALLMDACELIDIRQLYEIGAKISSTIDFQLSDESGHTVIQPGNSQNLDELKKLFYRVSDWLPKLKEDVVATVPHGARRCIEYCTMIPQLGFFVAVTLDPETNQGAYNGENSMDGEWELRFIADDLAFYKNPMMLELDAEHGDLHTRISDEEISIMVNLASEILVHEEAVTRSSDALGELDSLLALAAAAEKYNWTAPQITLSNVIEISEGRHPLQELIVPSFIPNDCSVEGGAGTLDGDDTSSYGSDDDSLSDNAEQTSNTTEGLGPHSGSRRNPHQASERGSESDHTIARGGDPPSPPSMLILTGPNNSGKSIYMKQVALIVFLAHIGSYVPALRATIGITDRILTRIATRETVVDDESAFLVDLRQAAFTINFATRRSLVLADEFGKGTSVETGSAVFAAYLAHFLAMEGDRPKVLVGTHFHDVFEHNLLEPLDFVGFAHMETHENPQARDVEDQLVYLYQLLPGRGPSSLALSCAAIHGVERAIIDRARELIGYMDNNEDLEVIMSRDRDERDAHKTGPARRIATGLINARLPYVDEPGGREGDVRELLRRLLAVEEEGERMDEGGGRDGYAGNIDMMDERGYEMEE